MFTTTTCLSVSAFALVLGMATSAIAQQPASPPTVSVPLPAQQAAPAQPPQPRVSTSCSEAANPAKAGADYATIKVLRPADGATVNDFGNVRLYMKLGSARLDNDGKIVQIFACPGETVGYRMKAHGVSEGYLLYEMPVPADAGEVRVVACNQPTGNCFRGSAKPGESVKLEVFDRPLVPAKN